MAQYYQVTSLEELHQLYPNLQLDNLESLQNVFQDDQVTQYSDAQGQQIIVDQSNLPKTVTSHQCNQTEFLIQQPMQYVIHQVEQSDLQVDGMQYIQQGQKVEVKPQFSDQVRNITSNPNQEEHLITQCALKSDGKQFVTQAQPVIHQPIQIHQEIQAVDGSNILVLQKQDHELIMSNKRPEQLSNQLGKQHHFVVQRQLQKTQQIPTGVQNIQNQADENSSLQFNQQNTQQLQNQLTSPCHIQQLKNSDSQMVQEVKYYNHVTVIDGLSQSNVVVEQATMTENQTANQSQVTSPLQQQQLKVKRITQGSGAPAVFQQHQQVLIPQRFEMSSPPPLTSRVNQSKNKGQEIDMSPGPVYIVQKFESPVMIRQPHTKIHLQSPSVISDKTNETCIQNASKESEKSTRNLSQVAQEIIHLKPAGLQIQSPRSSVERSQPVVQVKLGIIEQPYSNKIGDQINKAKVPPGAIIRTQTTRVIADQQTEAVEVSNGNDINTTENEKFVENLQPQSQSIPIQNMQIQDQTQNLLSGKPNKGGHTVQLAGVGQQQQPRSKGVQVQTSPPNISGTDGAVLICGTKPTKSVNKSVKAVWTVGQDQRQGLSLPGSSQVLTKKLSNETAPSSNETVEEARVLVLLLNGEKKMLRIPVSQQNIFLGQILQQAGISVASPTPVAVEQFINISKTDQGASKNSVENQTSKMSSVASLVSVPVTVEAISAVPAGISQQTSRVQQASNVNIPKHHLEFSQSRLPASSSSNLGLGVTNSNSKGTQNLIQITQQSKEEPRFVKGFMAICPYCGIQSLDFNKCIRCRRKLPENVKSQSIFDIKITKTEKANVETIKTDANKQETEKDSDSSGADSKGRTIIPDRKKIRPCVKKKKINEEPAEILILSSDEEEESKLKKTDVIKQILGLVKKEPVYAQIESFEKEMINTKNENCLNEDLMKNIQPGSYTTLQCRTIRIGSYKVQPKDRVLISNKGMRLVIPSLKNENVIIIIPVAHIFKMLLHFGKHISVIFVYPLPRVGGMIRNLLGMDDTSGPYYDPSGEEETHKRITFILDKISEDNKITLHKIFGQKILEDLSEKEANEILLRASPLEIQNSPHIRASDSVRKIMVYPPPPEKGGITLNNQDYACLGEDQFLNDVIIDFYLKYLLLKVLSPEDRNRTHVFSTFFYKRLTTKPKAMRKNDPENDPKLSPAEKRHMRVKGWTKQVNLFEKDFIIVPINEHSHWFLAIICFPGLTGPVRYSDNTPVEPEEVVLRKSAGTLQIGNTTITHIIKSDGNTISLEMDCGSDRDEAEGDQDDLQPSSEDEENEQGEEELNSNPPPVEIPLLAPITQPSIKDIKAKSIKRKMFKEPIKQPCILIFDSLAGASRVRVVATLRDYLKVEFKAKMGQDREFNKDTIKGAVPRVPQQNNFTDCGLYVLQYVESFFKDPLRDFKLPLKYLQEWFPEETVSTKRQKLADLIRSLMKEQGINVEEMGLPVLTFTNGINPADTQSRVDEEEEEEEEDDEMNDEDELIKHQLHTSDFEHEDDVDMDISGEEEEEDEEDEEDEEEMEEESEDGQMGTQRWPVGLKRTYSEGEYIDHKTNSLVAYEGSESEEESFTSNASDMFVHGQGVACNEMTEAEYCESEPLDKKTSSPLPEYQDFESEMAVTRIKRHYGSKHDLTDMVISDEGECDVESDDGNPRETSNSDNYLTGDGQNVSLVPRAKLQTSDTVLVDNRAMDVSDIIKKLVNEKKITIRRRDEETNPNAFKKQIEIRQFKAIDCDTTEDVENASSPCATQKNNLATSKRSFQALKSVRIPKKADRKLEVPDSNKRQKLDET